MKIKSHNKEYSGLIYLLLLFVFIFLLNRLMPLYSDDWVYSFIYKTNDRIENISDIFYSQYRHYYLWGGRTVAHVIVQFLLLINKNITDFLNAVVYISLIYIIYIFSEKSFKLNNLILLLIISSLLVLFLPDFTETVLFKTVSCNYLWTTVIVLFFLTPFVFNLYKSGNQKAIPIIMFLGGIIAGWTNENTGFALVIGVILFIILFKKKYNKIPSWAIYGLVGVIIGFSIMVLAPGNGLRENKGYLDNPNFSYLFFYLMRAKNILRIYMQYTFPLTFIYSLFLIIWRLSNKNKTNEAMYVSIIFLLMAQISIFVMIGSPVFPYRATFSTVVFLIVGISVLLSDIILKQKDLRKIFLIITIFLVLMSGYNYLIIYEETSTLKRIMEKREYLIDSYIENKVYDVVIPGENFNFETFAYPDVSQDSTFWLNRDYAKYKNIKTIRVGDTN